VSEGSDADRESGPDQESTSEESGAGSGALGKRTRRIIWAAGLVAAGALTGLIVSVALTNSKPDRSIPPEPPAHLRQVRYLVFRCGHTTVDVLTTPGPPTSVAPSFPEKLRPSGVGGRCLYQVDLVLGVDPEQRVPRVWVQPSSTSTLSPGP
jgi:hypothetical protein